METGGTKEEKWTARDGKVKQTEMERERERWREIFEKGETTRNWEQFLHSTRSPFCVPILAAGGGFRWTRAKVHARYR